MMHQSLNSLRALAAILIAAGIIGGCANSDFASSGASKTESKKRPVSETEEDEEKDQKENDDEDPDSEDKADDEEDLEADSDLEVDNGSNAQGDILFDDEELKCDKGKAGLVGKLYRLPAKTSKLPDFSTMTPLGQVEALQLNVPTREWKQGFPGVPDLDEWFAIEFIAALDVPEDGAYIFRTHSDDGSRLYIDDKLVVDNDGTHAPQSKSGSAELKKGKRKIKVEWFQGPRTQIALQVFWKRPNGAEEIIPATVLSRNKDCQLQDLGTFE